MPFVGLVLLGGGAFGVIAQWFGIGTVLAVFVLMVAVAITVASKLEEVQIMHVDREAQ